MNENTGGERVGFDAFDALPSREPFGNDCEEYKRLSKTYLASKGVVLSINKFEIENGRVKDDGSLRLWDAATREPRPRSI